MRKLVFKIGIIFLVIVNGLLFNHVFSCINEVDFENTYQDPSIVSNAISSSDSLGCIVLFVNLLVVSALLIFHYKTKATKDKN